MINIKVGYIRVSSLDQNTARQEAMMNENVERLFVDKASGKNMERPQLKEMLGFVRKGDVLIVESISRLARNTRDLLTIIEELNNKEVGFISLKENIDTNTPSGKFMLTVFAAVAELERGLSLIVSGRESPLPRHRASTKASPEADRSAVMGRTVY